MYWTCITKTTVRAHLYGSWVIPRLIPFSDLLRCLYIDFEDARRGQMLEKAQAVSLLFHLCQIHCYKEVKGPFGNLSPVEAFLIIGYVYSGSDGSNTDKATLSRPEGGGVSCPGI
ncbi:hypothetical protein L1887_28736 [Cichorium endivia]|nr:hypothetical protein L1887_28736 [Cichorium endivia]